MLAMMMMSQVVVVNLDGWDMGTEVDDCLR
jgi:hypothetical protein